MNGVSTSRKYRKLTREDLAAFDKHATELILAAMEAGCTGKISRKNHAILRNAAGSTEAVPRKMPSKNRTAQNAEAAIRRFIKEHRGTVGSQEEEDAPRPESVTMTVTEAFSRGGSGFSSWYGRQQGLAPDDRIRITYPPGNPDEADYCLIEAPDEEKEEEPVAEQEKSSEAVDELQRQQTGAAPAEQPGEEDEEEKDGDPEKVEAPSPHDQRRARLGIWLKEARVRAGLTQKELAAKAGIHQTSVSRIELGVANAVTLDKVVIIAETLGHGPCAGIDAYLGRSTGAADAGSGKSSGTSDAPQERTHTGSADDSETLQRIREILGPDPRVAELERRIADLDSRNKDLDAQATEQRSRADELETKLSIIRESLEL